MAEDTHDTATAQAATPRLRERFDREVDQKVAEKFGLPNAMERPRLEKIVVNVNVGRHLENGKLPANVKDTVLGTLTSISGQKPIVIRAKQSVSNFKLREGMESSALVTMRRDRMWHFLDRLINLATPRIRDFRGLPDRSFDRAGNYSMGLTEQGAFPEIDMARASFTHGMNINLVFSNSTPERSRFLLQELGMPFRRDD
jgi:large subunit ribosomal protein L5